MQPFLTTSKQPATTCPHPPTPKFFSIEEIQQFKKQPIPQHIAIIPDGNRRWAKRHHLKLGWGHREGANVLMDIVEAAEELGVQTLTLYAFSTENWNRSLIEIGTVMAVIDSYLRRQCATMVQNGVKLETIGDLSKLPKRVLKTLLSVKQATQHCNRINLVLALNYGSRDELCRAVQKIAQEYAQGQIKLTQMTEDYLANKLDTAPWGDPDLLIRTSGELRLSNFLLWQMSYAEVYVTDTLWPDFTPRLLFEALKSFQQRQRRLGE